MKSEGKGEEKSGVEVIKELFDEFNEKFPRPKEDGDAHEGGGYLELRVVSSKTLYSTKDTKAGNTDQASSDEEK